MVDGSTANTELTINPLPTPIRKGYAHSYAYGMGGETHLINIGQITINSGTIGAIEGSTPRICPDPSTSRARRRSIGSPSTRSCRVRRSPPGHRQHARRPPGHHAEHRDQHSDWPRTSEPAQCRWRHRSVERVADHRRPGYGRNPSAAQGNRQRKQCPVAQPAFDHHRWHRPRSPGLRLHPGISTSVREAPSSSAAAWTRRSSSSATSPEPAGS